MAPGFHIIVHSATDDDYLLSDSMYFPVQAINRFAFVLLLIRKQ